jgi:cytochrome c peroxidase
MRPLLIAVFIAVVAAGVGAYLLVSRADAPVDPAVVAELDTNLSRILVQRDFTGRVEETLEERLGRSIDAGLAEVGRLLFFDPILSLTGDNSCSGCHGPNVSFNDSRPIAIGVGNNGIVGPGRRGPYNQRRAPTLLNAAFFPRLMWDSRFSSTSYDPFNNAQGFTFPEPEGRTLSDMEHLLIAQAFTPVVNRVEMAGPDFAGDNDAMRDEVVSRVDAIAEYRRLFGEAFPEVAEGGALRYEHIARALAEFQFTLIRADAPIDRFARGETTAMTVEQKRGALLFFTPDVTPPACAECHKVDAYANQMFSDFEPHVLAVPQIVPGGRNVVYDGPGADEDYGLEQQTQNEADRYKFRTSPIRNAAFQPQFMHNGAYVCLDEAIRHHLDAINLAQTYSADRLDVALDGSLGPVEPMLGRVQELIVRPISLTEDEFDQVLAFVRDALTDPGAHPDSLLALTPETVPSGLPVHDFETNIAAPRCR